MKKEKASEIANGDENVIFALEYAGCVIDHAVDKVCSSGDLGEVGRYWYWVRRVQGGREGASTLLPQHLPPIFSSIVKSNIWNNQKQQMEVPPDKAFKISSAWQMQADCKLTVRYRIGMEM